MKVYSNTVHTVLKHVLHNFSCLIGPDVHIMCLKPFCGYIMHYVGNFKEDKSCMFNKISIMAILVFVIY